MLTRQWMGRMVVALALLLAVLPASAQELPDSSSAAVVTDQSDDSGGTTSDQSPPSSADATPTAAVDPQAVITQWGPAPATGYDSDQAVARRWLREQQAERARWGIPSVSRDPYLDWEAANALHTYLNEPLDPQPPGLTKPKAAQQGPESDRGVRTDQWYWTVPDDLWLAWLDTFQNRVPDAWTAVHSNEPWFTRERYLRLEEWRRQRFDRFRLVGVAGRIDNSKPPAPLLPFDQQTLEQLAPGSMQVYQPVNYSDSLVAVVAYDPWINPNGTIRP